MLSMAMLRSDAKQIRITKRMGVVRNVLRGEIRSEHINSFPLTYNVHVLGNYCRCANTHAPSGLARHSRILLHYAFLTIDADAERYLIEQRFPNLFGQGTLVILIFSGGITT